ncbi:lrr receptor-like serine/threonine-protein kinase ios1 [Quercus suber]|uniref:Lrr receptor-like serine/threonine-protein kinase ios1 n=1 Tax=Quercus suber TaxID=58331 RepID=A0AAW0M1H4_QUESU
MSCVSFTTTERPTMTYVVMELKQCLAMELARKHEGFEIDLDQISGMNFVHSGKTPLARAGSSIFYEQINKIVVVLVEQIVTIMVES